MWLALLMFAAQCMPVWLATNAVAVRNDGLGDPLPQWVVDANAAAVATYDGLEPDQFLALAIGSLPGHGEITAGIDHTGSPFAWHSLITTEEMISTLNPLIFDTDLLQQADAVGLQARVTIGWFTPAGEDPVAMEALICTQVHEGAPEFTLVPYALVSESEIDAAEELSAAATFESQIALATPPPPALDYSICNDFSYCGRRYQEQKDELIRGLMGCGASHLNPLDWKLIVTLGLCVGGTVVFAPPFLAVCAGVVLGTWTFAQMPAIGLCMETGDMRLQQYKCQLLFCLEWKEANCPGGQTEETDVPINPLPCGAQSP